MGKGGRMKEIGRVRKELKKTIKELHESHLKVKKYLVTKSLDQLRKTKGWTIAETTQIQKDFYAERKAGEKYRKLRDRFYELLRKGKDC